MTTMEASNGSEYVPSAAAIAAYPETVREYRRLRKAFDAGRDAALTEAAEKAESLRITSERGFVDEYEEYYNAALMSASAAIRSLQEGQ